MYYFLEASGADAAGGLAGANAISTVVMLVALIAIFYFFMYRPQKKQEKETNDMRNALQVGDEITTIGGIIGKIVSIKDETVL
ncbi:MAG: preprotein translocase subunit YajC, partial [Ruminococcaceae bacterium]|nr:preprotein translocase subunit YajC [Oscillospiraceae bacterium]